MTALVGRKDICRHCKRSWATIRAWIRDEAFPAKRIEGIWESDTLLVDEWRRTRIQPPCQEQKMNNTRS